MVYFRWVGVRKRSRSNGNNTSTALAACDERDSTWAYKHSVRAPVYAPFILNSVTEYITWGPPDACTDEMRPERSFICERKPGHVESLYRGCRRLKEPKMLALFLNARKEAAQWASLWGCKSSAVQKGRHLFYGCKISCWAKRLTWAPSFVTQSKISVLTKTFHSVKVQRITKVCASDISRRDTIHWFYKNGKASILIFN